MLVEYKPFMSQRRFGVEMELDPCLSMAEIKHALSEHESIDYGRQVIIETGNNLWAETKKNDFWHVKYDSSCGPTGMKKNGGGWEVASYIGKGASQVRSIAAAAGHLDEVGAMVNDYCGLHIHVEVDDFNVSRMGILLANWVRIEPLLFQACPQRRRRNRHCKPLRKKLTYATKLLAKDFYYALAPIRLHTHENSDKRYTINIVGFARAVALDDASRVTIELRLPESSLDPADVCGWSTVFVNFVDACSDRSIMPESLAPANLGEAFQILGLSGPPGRFHVPDRHLLSVKEWFLRRLIAHATQPGLAAESSKTLDFISKF